MTVDPSTAGALPGASVSLLEIEPDLAGALDDDERDEARRVVLPVAEVETGEDVAGMLEQSGAFGAIVLEGMLVQALQIGEDPTLRLIGPGSFVPRPGPPASMPVVGARLFAPIATRLVLLGEQLLSAVRRWPPIVSALHARMLEHSERLATQLAICQLPRVEDRLMALMWLLAESWGRVTPAGVRLPVSLSHEALGGLVGARRPTVTLAIHKLAEQGSLIRHEGEWLILEAPVAPVGTEPQAPQLVLTARGSSVWAAHDPVEEGPDELRDLMRHVAQTREESRWGRGRARVLAEQARTLHEQARRFMTGPGQEP